MDESDIDSDIEDDQSVTEEEQLLIAAATEILAQAAIEKRDLQLTSLLARKDELPLRTRNTLNVLVAELLFRTKNDIHEMICHNNIHDDDDQGLDSSRDTEGQVETAIRFFPEVISQPYRYGDGLVKYPIQRLCFSNRNNVSFIALLARLAIYFHSFEDHERGGLLIENGDGGNIFNNLLYKFGTCTDQNDLLLTLLIRLRRMGLFKKDDIRDYDLVSSSCIRDYILVSSLCCENDLLERVFQFLVEWDPTSLIRTNRHGFLPLHYAARTSIRVFRIAFGYGIRYYPLKKGISLLFRKDIDDLTPFQVACRKYGRDNVMNVVKETLVLCYSPHSDTNTPPPPQLNIAEAFITAAIDENNVHLDCLYFLLRRQPDMLMKLLSSSTAAVAAVVASTTQTATTTVVGSDNNDDSNDDDNDNNNCHTSKLRKRKREEVDGMNHNTN